MRRYIPYHEVAKVAYFFGAIEVYWRESDRSFTGFVCESWWNFPPRKLASNCAKVVGYPIAIRRLEGPGRFSMSVPVVIPDGEIKLGWASRGSRVELKPDQPHSDITSLR